MLTKKKLQCVPSKHAFFPSNQKLRLGPIESPKVLIFVCRRFKEKKLISHSTLLISQEKKLKLQIELKVFCEVFHTESFQSCSDYYFKIGFNLLTKHCVQLKKHFSSRKSSRNSKLASTHLEKGLLSQAIQTSTPHSLNFSSKKISQQLRRGTTHHNIGHYIGEHGVTLGYVQEHSGSNYRDSLFH